MINTCEIKLHGMNAMQGRDTVRNCFDYILGDYSQFSILGLKMILDGDNNDDRQTTTSSIKSEGAMTTHRGEGVAHCGSFFLTVKFTVTGNGREKQSHSEPHPF